MATTTASSTVTWRPAGSNAGDYSSVYKWLKAHPLINNRFEELNATDKQTYLDTFLSGGRVAAKEFLNSALGTVNPRTATTEIEGVSVPTATKYPTPTLITSPDALKAADYDYVQGIGSTQAGTVKGIKMPGYTATGGISGTGIKRVGDVSTPDYQGAGGINQYAADSADYNMVDPMDFASQYGESYRNEVLKNASLADQIALQQLNTELGGLVDYAQASAALKRQETSIDNAFNQAQRTAQLEQGAPGVLSDLEAQRSRASSYAEGRLPDSIEDRMMELNVRSRAADATSAAGFGNMSLASQKASNLMSAEQRLGVAQMGEQLMSQNIATRAELYLAPTEYISAGQQISVMPSQSASVLSASSLGQLNELANVSATTALGTTVGQEQFSANLANDISKFNTALKQDTDKFNSSLREQQAQFDANMQTQIAEFNAQIASNENLTEAQIQQRTQEFNANLSAQQSQFKASLEQSVSAFNANLAVTQNQFNASLAQRTGEFNANLATQQNQFVTSLGQRVAEYNTTMEYNTAVANTGIENTFALGKFDYAVTYKGLIAGAINKAKDTALQLELAQQELAIYGDAMFGQLDLERQKLEAMRNELTPGSDPDVDPNKEG